MIAKIYRCGSCVNILLAIYLCSLCGCLTSRTNHISETRDARRLDEKIKTLEFKIEVTRDNNASMRKRLSTFLSSTTDENIKQLIENAYPQKERNADLLQKIKLLEKEYGALQAEREAYRSIIRNIGPYYRSVGGTITKPNRHVYCCFFNFYSPNLAGCRAM